MEMHENTVSAATFESNVDDEEHFDDSDVSDDEPTQEELVISSIFVAK